MNLDQPSRARAFQALHTSPGGFVVANPWDRGSARLLAMQGFKALATTSAGFAFSCGLADHAVRRGPMLRYLEEMAAASDLPVTADLESGFGANPTEVAETFRLAVGTGIVGASIEDSTGVSDAPLMEIARAADRVRAAKEAVASLPFPFTLTARAENYFVGRPDLADTIARLQAYQEAGADVLYAPGLIRAEDIKAVLSSVDRPVNVLFALAGMRMTVEDLFSYGVKRVSVGGSLLRAAYGELQRAASELLTQGTMTYAGRAFPGSRMNELMSQPIAKDRT